MNMKIQIITLVLSAALTSHVSGQFWTSQAADITGNSLFIGDISAVDENVAWAIASSFAGGFCGTPVRKFTRTTDGGATWESGSIPAPSQYTTWNICALDAQTAWVSTSHLFNGNNGRIYKTIDGGETWTHQTTANFSSAAKFVYFFDENHGVCVGENEIFTTTDGGVNWNAEDDLPVPFAAATNFVINSYEVIEDHIWLGDSYGAVYHSADQGNTWTNLVDHFGPMGQRSIKGIAFKDELNGMAICSHFVQGGNGGGADTDDGTFFTTNDGGNTWTSQFYTSPTPEFTFQTFAKYDICYVPGTTDTYILTSEYAGLAMFSAITTDGGESWDFIDTEVAHTALDFVENGTGWSGGYITSANDGIFKHENTVANIQIPSGDITKGLTILYNDQDEISLSNQSSVTIESISILSIDGKRVRDLGMSNNQNQPINIQSLAHGIYLLEISGGNQIIHKKFIVQ